MEDVEPGAGGSAGEPDERPPGVGRRVCPLGYAFEVRRRRVGLPTEDNDVRCIREGQERRHQTFDIAPDARCGRGKGPAIYTNPQTSLIGGMQDSIFKIQNAAVFFCLLPFAFCLLPFAF